MYVYFIKAKGHKFYKIGKSNEPYDILNKMRYDCPYTPQLKLCLEYNEEEENLIQTLHKLFKKKKTYGDWFELDSADIIQVLKEQDYTSKIVEIPKKEKTIINCEFCGTEFQHKNNKYRHRKENRYCRMLQQQQKEIDRLTNELDQAKLIKTRKEKIFTETQRLEILLDAERDKNEILQEHNNRLQDIIEQLLRVK